MTIKILESQKIFFDLDVGLLNHMTWNHVALITPFLYTACVDEVI